MRNYKVQVNENTHIASAEPTSKNSFRVKLNGGIFECESIADEDFLSWSIRSRDEMVLVRTRVLPNDKVEVWVEGLPFSVSVQASLPAEILRTSTSPVGEKVGGRIKALMPGRVTSVLVSEGETVDAGAPLLILEAMKMQNEIESPVAGRVSRVYVQEGEAVKKDTVLVVVD